MLNYLLTSFIGHFILLVLLSHSYPVNTEKIEVTFLPSAPKVSQNGQKPLKSATPAKPLKSHDEGFSAGKPEEIDLTDYANQVKLKVDPVWVRNISGVNKKYYLEVLLLVDKRGSIRTIKIIKSSGYLEIDETAIATFREVANLPNPPQKVVDEGIIWELGNE